MPEDYAPILTAELQVHGVTAWEIDRAHKHPRIRFNWNGRDMMFVYPSSPSDKAGIHNALSDLRKVMGVRRIIHKSAAPPKRRTRAFPARAPDSITVRSDPFAALAKLGVAMKLGIAMTARQAGLRAFMAGCGDAPTAGFLGALAAEFRAGWWVGHGGMDAAREMETINVR